ncbi:hypothetical protein SASPL_115118 [Salvia splendens]|uniref:Uncharacterized protein n=1 Tax=Salvia splendens TaxID=180675 RepID=A0A8X8Y7D9_SALSN|nr:hypothetical protein SASPL_115118 [Salvia splendens]
MAAGQQRAASLLLLSGSDSTTTNSRVSVAVLAAAVGATNGWKNAAVVVVDIPAAMDDNQLRGYVVVCEDSCHYKAGVRAYARAAMGGTRRSNIAAARLDPNHYLAVEQVGSLVDPNMRAGAVRAGRIAEVRDAGVGWVGSNKLWGIIFQVHCSVSPMRKTFFQKSEKVLLRQPSAEDCPQTSSTGAQAGSSIRLDTRISDLKADVLEESDILLASYVNDPVFSSHDK